MRLSEDLLFLAARALYRTDIAHSSEMKSALQTIEAYDRYRSGEIRRILEASERCGVKIAGKTVVDLGCNDGAVSVEYLRSGARKVIGLDIDEAAVCRAREVHQDDRLEFLLSSVDAIPLADRSVDLVISYDVFEHVARPEAILRELHRILASGGQVLIGTWGWFHPFAPHLWSVMPVPWAHVFFSEPALLRVCRRVYHSRWYVPNMHDFDASGRRKPDKYTGDAISAEYLNKFLIKDFEKAFAAAGFRCRTRPVPFGSSYARWTRHLLGVPWLREFLSGYVWFALTKLDRGGAPQGT
jgi:SAM-dependent methyltransferase